MKRLLGIRTRSGISRTCRVCRCNTGCVAVTRGVLRRSSAHGLITRPVFESVLLQRYCPFEEKRNTGCVAVTRGVLRRSSAHGLITRPVLVRMDPCFRRSCAHGRITRPVLIRMDPCFLADPEIFNTEFTEK